MRPLRNILALAAPLVAAVFGFVAPAAARPADQVFSVADPAGGRIEAGVWLPDSRFAGPRPLVVISHGNGGVFSGHHDTAEALADAGFVVAALTHPGDNWRDASRQTQLADRPRHVSLLIDYMIRDWSGPAKIDASRIGAFGFSAGGFTVTTLVGGVSDPGRIAQHCLDQPQAFVCRLLAQSPIDAKGWKPASRDPRIKAAVIAAPGFGLSFTDQSLAAVKLPIQLWSGEADVVLPARFHAESVRDRLGRKPEFHSVPGAGHFDFLPPCPPELATALPDLCRSQPGFDRAAFHVAFNREVVRFFQETL